MIQKSDWYLEKPHVHFRYYCEVWMDLLLGWVKYFYIPDLDYHRYERLSGYREFLKIVERFGDGLDTRGIMLLWLKQRFKQEVEEWTDTAKQARQFWDSVHEMSEKDNKN